MTDPIDLLMLGMRYLHILGAIALMGGTIFARFAVVPALAELSAEDREKLHTALRSRWAKFVGLASAMILISGIANLGLYGALYKFPSFPYNPVAGVKFLLALPIFFIAALLTGKTGLAKKIQANAKFWMTVNLVLALSMVLIGGGLRFVKRVPKKELPATVETDRSRTLFKIAVRQ